MNFRESDVTHLFANYHHEQYLGKLLDSVRLGTCPVAKTILIDNGSDRQRLSEVERAYPALTVVRNERNLGFCAAMNQGIRVARTRYALITGPDVELESNCLARLMDALHAHADAIIASAKILRMEDKNCIQSAGSTINYAGQQVLLNWFHRNDALSAAENSAPRETGAFDSTACVVDLDKFKEVGLFDEDFFLYVFEMEFSLRARITGGYTLLYVPAAVAYHGFGSKESSYSGRERFPALRAYELSKNRWLAILKLYRLRSIIMLLPAFAVYELSLLFFMAGNKVGGAYFKGIAWNISHLPSTLKKRRRIQKMRKINDGQVLCSDSISIHKSLYASSFLYWSKTILDLFLKSYWIVVRPFL
jgi:hypothetical protein